MNTSSFVERTGRQHGALATTLPGSSLGEVSALRQQALLDFEMRGLPTLRDEAWRYTNMRLMNKREFEPAFSSRDAAVKLTLETLERPALDSLRMVFVDGRFSPEFSFDGQLPEGLTLTNLSRLLNSESDASLRNRVLACATDRLKNSAHAFDALNTAFLAEGAVIVLAAGLKLAKPIELMFISSRSMEAKFSNTASFVFGGADSSANIVETHIATHATQHLSVSSLSARLDEACEIDHCRIQNDSSQAVHVGYTCTSLAADSRCAVHAHNFGALVARHDVTQIIEAPHAHAELNGLCVATGRQHMDNYTNIMHDREQGTSSEHYRSILDDRAKSVFHGRIRVAPDAQQTDAQQQNNNLLLSPHADATTKPQLEIYADDVKCSHGATVGELDEQAVFYLRSRGIDRAEARAMLTRGFASEIVESVTLEPVRAFLTQALYNKLNKQSRLSRAA